MEKFFEKIGNFFETCSPSDVVMLATLFLIPVLVVILLIVTIVRHARSKREKAEMEAYSVVEEVPVEEETPVSAEPAPVAAPAADPAPAPVHHVAHAPAEKTPERVKVKVRVTNLKKADKYLLAATGIFCIGLGAMIQRAMSGDK